MKEREGGRDRGREREREGEGEKRNGREERGLLNLFATCERERSKREGWLLVCEREGERLRRNL